MVRTVLKFALWITVSIIALAMLAAAGVWTFGSLKINEKFTAPAIEIRHSTDPAIIAEGARLATVTGCNGCHGERMQGNVFAKLPDGTRLTAPNLPRVASTYSDEDLARAIRYGVRNNGRGVMAMPSEAFFSLTDDDLIAILSYIRATPDEGGDLPNTRIGLAARFFLASGEFKTAPRNINDMAKRPTYDFSDPLAKGLYLATIACSECHGTDFKGQSDGEEFSPPDLIVGSAYSLDQFHTLMKTGVGKNGRDLRLMSEVAQRRFSSFTDDEINSLYAFLTHRALTYPDG